MIEKSAKCYSKEYRAWINMRSRCKTRSSTGFQYYGGRGIRVCDRWQSFDLFYADMGERPSSKHSVDRINVNGDYEPSNCRWSTKVEQARNTTANRFVTLDGKIMPLAQAVEVRGLKYNTILYRLLRGWDEQRALS